MTATEMAGVGVDRLVGTGAHFAQVRRRRHPSMKQFVLGRKARTEIIDLANKAQPLLAQALPLVNQAIIEIDSVLPAAQDILAYLQTKPADVPSTVDIMTQQGSGPT